PRSSCRCAARCRARRCGRGIRACSSTWRRRAKRAAPIAARCTFTKGHRSRDTEGTVSRILIVAPNWIGDALMAQPLLARLRQQRPDTKVDMLAPAWVAPVARRMPEDDEVITKPV